MSQLTTVIILLGFVVAVAVVLGSIQVRIEAECRMSTRLVNIQGDFTTNFKNCPPLEQR